MVRVRALHVQPWHNTAIPTFQTMLGLNDLRINQILFLGGGEGILSI